MPQRQTQPAAQTQRAEEEAAPLASTSLRVVDYCGRRRQGSAVILPRRSLGLISAKLEEGEDFRIIMLAEPPDGPVSPAEGVVVVAPARPISSAAQKLSSLSFLFLPTSVFAENFISTGFLRATPSLPDTPLLHLQIQRLSEISLPVF